jgi:hypothetical protein
MSGISLGFAALLLVLGATVVWSYRAFKVDLPKDLGGFAAAWGVGAVIGVIALFQGTANPGAAITAVVLGGLMLFLLKTGRQKSGDRAIAVGDRIPDFSAPDENGEIFESSSLAGSAVVLKVFRGHW